jgi:hypothetical protein
VWALSHNNMMLCRVQANNKALHGFFICIAAYF